MEERERGLKCFSLQLVYLLILLNVNLFFLMQMHFVEALSARHKGGDTTKLVTKGLRGKSASEKLTEEGLVKFSARVSIQVNRYIH